MGFESREEPIPLNRGDEPLPGGDYVGQARETMRHSGETGTPCPQCGGTLEVLELEGEERYSCPKDGPVIPDQETKAA